MRLIVLSAIALLSSPAFACGMYIPSDMAIVSIGKVFEEIEVAEVVPAQPSWAAFHETTTPAQRAAIEDASLVQKSTVAVVAPTETDATPVQAIEPVQPNALQTAGT